MKKKLLAALIAATMVVPTIAAPVFAEETEPENTVTGDASAEGSFVVWGWNDDIKKFWMVRSRMLIRKIMRESYL